MRKGLLTTVRDVIGLRIGNLARLRCGKTIRPWSVNINRPWFGKNFGSCFGKVDRLYSAGMSIDHGAETSIDYGSERSLDHGAEKSIDYSAERYLIGDAHHASLRRGSYGTGNGESEDWLWREKALAMAALFRALILLLPSRLCSRGEWIGCASPSHCLFQQND